jgi:hypothetical protein
MGTTTDGFERTSDGKIHFPMRIVDRRGYSDKVKAHYHVFVPHPRSDWSTSVMCRLCGAVISRRELQVAVEGGATSEVHLVEGGEPVLSRVEKYLLAQEVKA